MNKALWIVGTIIVLIGISLGFLYHDALSYKKDEAKAAQKKATGNYNIKEIKNTSAYDGDATYHVLDAVLQDGKEVYLMLPEDEKKDKSLMLPVDSGYTKKEILNAFKSHISYREIVSTQLGVVDGTPAWEIVYKDDENRFVFSYYNFYNGDSLLDPIAIQ